MKKTLLTTLLFGLSFTGLAQAQITTNFNSTALLESKCIMSAQNINLGNLNVIGPLAPTQEFDSTLTVHCSRGVTYKIGQAAPGSVNIKVPLYGNTPGNNDILVVGMFFEAGARLHWGTGSGLEITGTGTGLPTNHIIGARFNRDEVFSQHGFPGHNRTASPDTYSNTVTATVTY